MENHNEIQLFEDRRIRTAWDGEKEEWYFSVVDVVGVLTEQTTPRGASTYWAVLKKRLLEEGAQLLTNCKQLKMIAADGKRRLTDVANLFSPLIGLEKILSSAIIQIRGMFHDKKGLHSRIQRTDIKGIPGGWECFACR